MKNMILSVLLSIVMTESAVPQSDASVPSNMVFVPSSSKSWSKTAISGDANHDNTVNIADAILLQQYMSSGEFDGNVSCFDINSDGIIDSFDMILMRQAIINQEEPAQHTYAVDILNSSESIPEDGKVLTNVTEVSEYLSEFIPDTAEIQTYLEKYNDDFFENNNLILMPFNQKYGRGVFYNVSGVSKIRPKKTRGLNDDVFISLEAEYNAYRVLYPVTDTKLLIQAGVPKNEVNSGENVFIYDSYEIKTNMEAISYTSPDKSREIYVTQETTDNLSDIRFFLKTNKISYKALTFLTAYGDKPFTEDGEWSVNADGNDVFSNGTTYSMTWYDDHIAVNHKVQGDEWEYISVDFNGEEIIYKSYIKSN
ncbi:MAG: dockerin type I repeat-containing protein [Ruminococcus sp.]|nr:dockerin type I repeat-containing protein [Ruminococcus sp.]